MKVRFMVHLQVCHKAQHGTNVESSDHIRVKAGSTVHYLFGRHAF